MKKYIMSLDAETNGLWGQPFAVAGIIYNSQTGEEVDKICLRLPNDAVTDSWVVENVLPTLNFPVTHTGNILFDTQIGKEKRLIRAYESMLRDFAEWYMKYKDESEVLWHMGHIVESHLFREMHRLNFIGDWDAPYVPIEVSAYLQQAGEPADSVDSYAKKHNLNITDYGTTHNMLYDCEVAFKCYFHIINSK